MRPRTMRWPRLWIVMLVVATVLFFVKCAALCDTTPRHYYRHRFIAPKERKRFGTFFFCLHSPISFHCPLPLCHPPFCIEPLLQSTTLKFSLKVFLIKSSFAFASPLLQGVVCAHVSPLSFSVRRNWMQVLKHNSINVQTASGDNGATRVTRLSPEIRRDV